jgi:cytochrome b pre-mRNA-processing protein 3
MMLTRWFKNRAARRNAARGLYRLAVAQARLPVFYERLGVADTIDGRFDLIILHVFLIVDRLRDLGPEGRRLGQTLFDQMFTTIDLTLREMGVGDLGVPKHMKKMMKAFNGRLHSYHEALSTRNEAALELAVSRNIYRANGEAVPAGSTEIAAYILAARDGFENVSLQDLLTKGAISFPSFGAERKEAVYG